MSSSGANLESFLIPLKEINLATQDFNPETRIGDGGFGVVHKGKLSELWQDRTVAIKRLDLKGYQRKKEFLTELKLISKFNHENIIRTDFYLDPIYHESGILHKASDVYSYGVVLFEMLIGMLAYNRRSLGDDNPQTLIILVRRYYENELEKLVDPFIRDQIDYRCFDAFKRLAYECISYDSQKRPTMDTIMKRIEDAMEFQVRGDPLRFGDFAQDDYEVSKPPSFKDIKATFPNPSDDDIEATSPNPSDDDIEATSPNPSDDDTEDNDIEATSPNPSDVDIKATSPTTSEAIRHGALEALERWTESMK
ncbi:hypothetical protein L1887_06741 [Cichorium endivia]|nr:hypothetical protein L1887_06741 [Cichorium endivia]